MNKLVQKVNRHINTGRNGRVFDGIFQKIHDSHGKEVGISPDWRLIGFFIQRNFYIRIGNHEKLFAIISNRYQISPLKLLLSKVFNIS